MTVLELLTALAPFAVAVLLAYTVSLIHRRNR